MALAITASTSFAFLSYFVHIRKPLKRLPILTISKAAVGRRLVGTPSVAPPFIRPSAKTSLLHHSKRNGASKSQDSSPVEGPSNRASFFDRLHVHRSRSRSKSHSRSPFRRANSSKSSRPSSPNASNSPSMAAPPLPALTTTLASSSNSSGRHDITPDTATKETANTEAFSSNRAAQVESMPHFLTISRSDIALKFQELEWKQRFRISHATQNPTTSPYVIDKTNDILLRNRYGNIQPWAKSRIKLKAPDGHCDYINASPIVLKSVSEMSVETKYIATQGPKDNQFSHFWNMVMAETTDPAIIIMLTQTHEGPREKCAQYFPPSMDNPKIDFPSLVEEPSANTNDVSSDTKDEPSLDEKQQPAETESSTVSTNTSGSIALNSLVEPHDSCRYAFRDMTLEISNKTKQVYHYLFPSWADFSKPEAEDRQGLIEVMQDSAMRCGKIAENARIVHCSAGVGRTGTFIAVDHLIRELESGALDNKASEGDEGKSTVNNNLYTEDKSSDLIFETVNALREQRMLMVMNEIQYSFIYDVLKEAWEKRHLHGKRKPEPESPPTEPALAPAVKAPAASEAGGRDQPLTEDSKRDGNHPPPPTEGIYAAELEARSPKVARKAEPDGGGVGIGADIYHGTKVEIGGPVKDEDTVSSDEEFQESKEEWDKA